MTQNLTEKQLFLAEYCKTMSPGTHSYLSFFSNICVIEEFEMLFTAEKDVFEANTSFLKLTRNIFIELHYWLRPGCSKAFFKSLDKYDYECGINIENTIIRDLKRELVN